MPAAIPAATPDVRSMVPAVILSLIQVPPAVALVRATVEPSHTEAVPVIAPGNEFTTIVSHVRQPVDNE